MLITTAGTISCEIVKANDNFLFCQNVKFQDINLDKLYVERSSVVAFTNISDKKTNVTNFEDEIKQTKIINFSKYLNEKRVTCNG